MTSDDISDADWQRVRELATEIANLAADEDDSASAPARKALLSTLDQLDEKYGLKPSLLATRADYEESAEKREGLLQIGFAEAARIDDQLNRALIAQSLAELYIEELGSSATAEDRADIGRLKQRIAALPPYRPTSLQ